MRRVSHIRSGLAAVLACGVLGAAHVRTQAVPLSVKITSPMGRMGLNGPVRIVAQVHTAETETAVPLHVQFFVNQQLLTTVDSGPPYAAEWTDENPFDKGEIEVRAIDALGHEAKDTVVLEPFQAVEESQITSVLVEASVRDKSGKFIRGLDASNLALAEDGVPQVLDMVHQEDVGATFALLVDSSSSMSRNMDFVQRTAGRLASFLRSNDRVLVAPFSRRIGPTTGPTNDQRTIVESIDAIRPAGGTAILDSLCAVSETLRNADGRRAIVLITDGYDENSTHTFDEAMTAVKQAQATVYVVGIGGVAGVSIKGERLLRQLATETGGRFFFPARDEQLQTVRDTLVDDVENRYLLSYTPTNQAYDGQWRAIAVHAGDPDYVVRARLGYFAPKPAPIRPTIEFTADEDGRYLDLTADDLEISEEGVPQQVTSFTEAVQPVSIVLALDESGSMKKSEADVIESAREFVSALRKEDQLALVLFSDHSTFVHDLSTNRESTFEAISQYKANGGTALYDAMADSLHRLKRVEGRRVVVVMTDGRDEDNPGTGPGSIRRFDDVLAELKDSGATVFSIGLGTKVDRGPIQEFADRSGGLALFPTDVTELATQFQRIIEDLRRRYIVGFTSTRTQHDGKWRHVDIRVKSSPKASVRSIGGYWAPGAVAAASK
jgi:Ca-activated chloride channel family protein